MIQLTLDFKKAEKLRDHGISRASLNADFDYPGWSRDALELLKDFLTIYENDFMSEHFRVYAKGRGLPVPPSNRAFGGVIKQAAKDGLIKAVGFGLTKNPLAHRTPARIWRAIRG